MAAGERPERTTENCRFCWMCRHVCPVGLVTARETYTPHAWALAIESVRRGQLVWNDETASVMYACADCGLCRTHCVTDQPLPDAIVSARADIVDAGAAPAAVRGYLHRLEKLFAGPSPPLPTSERLLFAGDAPSPSVAAAQRLLEASGLPVKVGGVQQSTGLRASTLGLRDVATRLARRFVSAVVESGARELFVLRPAEKWTFEHVYPHRLGVAWPSHVLVTEVTPTIAAALARGELQFDRRSGRPPAYHDPCHSGRVGRDHAGPRRLIAAVYDQSGPSELFWREARAHPCGALGGLEITHPPLAAALASARVKDACASGAGMLVTDDPSCLQHLHAHADGRLVVASLHELLADALITR
jgi:Fe-S oxidoreductase